MAIIVLKNGQYWKSSGDVFRHVLGNALDYIPQHTDMYDHIDLKLKGYNSFNYEDISDEDAVLPDDAIRQVYLDTIAERGLDDVRVDRLQELVEMIDRQ